MAEIVKLVVLPLNSGIHSRDVNRTGCARNIVQTGEYLVRTYITAQTDKTEWPCESTDRMAQTKFLPNGRQTIDGSHRLRIANEEMVLIQVG